MARPKSPEREEARRSAILEAAARVFARDGLQGAAISAICREAGISAGQLYYYFAGKEALIEAMAEADLARIRGLAENLTTLDELLSAAVAVAHPLSLPDQDKPQMLAGSLAFDLHAEASRNPRLHAIVRAHYEAISGLFGEKLRHAQQLGEIAPHHDPLRLARMVGAVREGLLTMASVSADFVDDTMRREIRAMLERAAAGQAPQAGSSTRS
jgi:AcrR family transcriptional regulator